MDPNAEPSEYVTLASNDGFEFVITRDAACISGTIRRMLDPKSLDTQSPVSIDPGSCKHMLTVSLQQVTSLKPGPADVCLRI